MTRQEIFNKAYLGLKAQGFKQALVWGAVGDTCRYRGDNGTKCAIGHLISDELASNIEGFSVGTLNEIFLSELKAELGVTDQDIDFLEDLQDRHDSPYRHSQTGNVECGLVNFAREYGLTIPE